MRVLRRVSNQRKNEVETSNDEALTGEVSGPEVAKMVDSLLDKERSASTAMMARALTVVTTSATLVTLLLGFATLSIQERALPSVPWFLKAAWILAVLFLVSAAVVGLILNADIKSEVRKLSYEGLSVVFEYAEVWNAPPVDVTRGIALDEAGVLADEREANFTRHRLLGAAIVLEVLGVVFAGVSVGIVVSIV
ncbi:hypothetical protein ACF1A5_18920 [Streptomyces sp. NPDC014864]|uniref:hypothetical protein n=1 Tax=Streptomyces sp. NPDC014864 TaxID=3364924 RepID=UPI0036FAF7E7